MQTIPLGKIMVSGDAGFNNYNLRKAVALYFTVSVLPWYMYGKYIVPTGKWVVTKYLPEVYVHGNT